MNLLILGPQGSGKGTQVQRLSDRLHLPNLSMGALLRAQAASGTTLGQELQAILAAGQLVSAEVAARVLKARLEEPDTHHGYLLDGFPRNLEQYRSFCFRQPDHVLLIEIPKEESVHRLRSRVVCSTCGQNSSLLTEGVELGGMCPCGGVWERRTDDTEEIILERLRIYEEETSAVLHAYRMRGLLRVVNGLGSEEEVEQRLLKVLGK